MIYTAVSVLEWSVERTYLYKVAFRVSDIAGPLSPRPE